MSAATHDPHATGRRASRGHADERDGREPQHEHRQRLEEIDLERLRGERLVPHQDDVDRIAERRAEDRGAAEQHIRPELGPRLAEHDHDHAGEGHDRAADRAPADLLAEEDGGKQQGDQRRDEGQRDRLGQRHPADAPEEQERP